MRLLFAVSLLALACSSKSSLPDANDLRDTSVEMTTDVSVDYPNVSCPSSTGCCTNTTTQVSIFPLCNQSACVPAIVDAAADPNGGCFPCPGGYACALNCSNGFCGGSST